jgi:predicted peptidase
VEQLKEAYNVDRKRIYVTGISAGAHATWEMLLRHPKQFAAAVPMAALGRKLPTTRCGVSAKPPFSLRPAPSINTSPLSTYALW